MRLICPNCGAQYEVADDVIPAAGRDVQCSNCGHTWLEQPGASVAREHPEEPNPASKPQAQPEPDQPPQPEPAHEPEPVHDPAPEPKRRQLDPDVTDILRQEAEYEQTARAAEADPIETQPEMDLSHDPEDDRRSREARDRLARLRGEKGVTTNVAAATAIGATIATATNARRRELLPDIEEINSTLRPDTTPSAAKGTEEVAQARSGFRRGFLLMVVVALIFLALYVFAPQISAAIPEAEPILTAYVEWLNGLRLWLDGQIASLVAQQNTAN